MIAEFEVNAWNGRLSRETCRERAASGRDGWRSTIGSVVKFEKLEDPLADGVDCRDIVLVSDPELDSEESGSSRYHSSTDLVV